MIKIVLKPINQDVALFKVHLEAKGLKYSTIKVWCQYLAKFILSDPDLEDINSYNLFLIEHSINKRVYSYYYVLKEYINMKITNKETKEYLILNMIKPEMKEDFKKPRKFLSLQQQRDIIVNMKEYKHQVLAFIMMLSGARIGDLLKMKSDKLISEKHIVNGKEVHLLQLHILGKRDRPNIVPIYEEKSQQFLLDYMTRRAVDDKVKIYEDYLFLDETKWARAQNDLWDIIRANYNNFLADLKQAIDKAGLDSTSFSSHDFRRCFARRAWNKWHDLKYLMELLRHRDPRTTLRYLSQSGLQNLDLHYEMQIKPER